MSVLEMNFIIRMSERRGQSLPSSVSHAIGSTTHDACALRAPDVKIATVLCCLITAVIGACREHGMVSVRMILLGGNKQ